MVSVKQVVSKYAELASLAITLLKNPKHRDEDVKKAVADIQLCVKEGRKDDIFIQLQPFLVDHIDLHLLESLIELSCEDSETKQVWYCNKCWIHFVCFTQCTLNYTHYDYINYICMCVSYDH